MPNELDLSGLIEFVNGVEDAMSLGAGVAAVHVGNLASQFCPVDEGDLRDSIRVEDGPTPLIYFVLAGDPSATKADGRPVDYAPHVEYGTANSPAQPFMTPAAEAIKPELEVAAEVAELAARCRR